MDNQANSTNPDKKEIRKYAIQYAIEWMDTEPKSSKIDMGGVSYIASQLIKDHNVSPEEARKIAFNLKTSFDLIGQIS